MTKENKPRANEERFDTLHNMVTEELITRLNGKPETADLKAAMDWLRHNGVNAPATTRSPLGTLAGLIPDLDIELVQERAHGTKALV